MNTAICSWFKLGVNALSVLGGDVLNRASIFIVYAMLSRYEGLHEFGQLSLGLLLLYTFQVFGVAGLPITITREVAKRPKSARRLLGHGYRAALLSSTLAALAMAGSAWALQYQWQTIVVIGLLAVAIPASSLMLISEAVIKGREKMHLIALGNLPGSVFLVVAGYLVLSTDYGVIALAAAIVGSRCITLWLMHRLACRETRDCRSRHIRLRFSWMLLRRSTVFLSTDGLNAICAALTGILLSKFASEREVGLLSASFQLLQPILMGYRSVGHSSFPVLVAAARRNLQAVEQLSRTLIGFLLRLAIPATAVVFVLSGDLMRFVYGNDDFRDAAIVLQIVAFTLLLDPLSPVLGHALWAVNRDRAVLRIVIVNLIANTLLGLFLISKYGLLGAACTALICSLINVGQHVECFQRNIGPLALGRQWIRILPAVLLGAVCFGFSPADHYTNALLAVSVYFALAFIPLDSVFTRWAVSQNSGT